MRGIIEKMDYMVDLGVDILWLNPIYKSPNDDNGYDISDYYQIHEEYGTLDDLVELLDLLHSRGMKLVMDMVINHSSDEHEWFRASKQNDSNEYADYYIWRSGKSGGPPNNWPSFFGGSAWEYVESRDAYYLHLFTKKQPDLNWENPNVQKEFDRILKYWLDLGIDGFRLDVIPLLSKDLSFVDSPYDDFGDTVSYIYSNGPHIHKYLKGINDRVFSKYDILTVGEGPGITKELANLYVGDDRNELDMIFQLEHMFIDHGPDGRFDPKPFALADLKALLNEWDAAIGDRGWLSVFLDNHDFPRMVSRFGNDGPYRVQSAKMLAMMILTMRGTPCIYFGSEIGMTNVSFPSISDYRDVETHNFYQLYREKGLTEDHFLELVERQGRDNVRTPMYWDASANGGFTDGIPWIKVNPNYLQINVDTDASSEDSIRKFYKDLLAWRKQHLAVVYGSYVPIWVEHPSLFAYVREGEKELLLVVLNFSDSPVQLPQPSQVEGMKMEISNYNVEDNIFAPWEGRIYKKV